MLFVTYDVLKSSALFKKSIPLFRHPDKDCDIGSHSKTAK
jgi:hypothetical protein